MDNLQEKEISPVKTIRKVLFGISWLLIALWTQWWSMCLLFACAIASIFLYKSNLYRQWTQRKVYTVYKSLKLLFGALIMSFLLKSLVVGLYTIPSGSMEDTILIGDIVLVEKLTLGPIVPKGLFKSFWSSNNRSNPQSKRRTVGFGKLKRGDVIVFDHPNSRKPITMIKRMVGFPGDTFQIKRGNVWINNQKLNESSFAKLEWSVPKYDSIRKVDKMGKRKMTEQKAMTFFSSRDIEDQKFVWQPKNGRKVLFPHDKKLFMSSDYWSVPYIPKEGQTIDLSIDNYKWYERIITKHEGHTLDLIDGIFLLDDQPVSHYTFQDNYYVALGDNRHGSRDSRWWGFVPEKNIIGIAKTVLLSVQKSGKLRDNRYLKSLKPKNPLLNE